MGELNRDIQKKHAATTEKSMPEVEDAVEEYRPRLLRFVRSWVKEEEDAEDLVQDVFLRFAKTLSENAIQIEQLSAWMFKVARNTIISFGRKKRAETLPDNDERDWSDFAVTLFNSDNPTPETVYLRSLVWDELAEALSELPAEQREVFEMTELEGMSIKEISQRTGVPAATLLSRKHYAVKHLRLRLADIYSELIDC